MTALTGAPTLVLDLDGTLVETIGDLTVTLNVVLEGAGMAPLSVQQARGAVGYGAKAMIESAYTMAGRTVTEQELQDLTDQFIAHYSQNLTGQSHAFPGAVEALDRFTAEGWRLAVCTNKLESLAVDLLGELDLADRFAAICGQDTFGCRKPDARHLLETVRLAGGSAGDAIMVGDAATDINVAKNARVPVVGVTFGYSATPVADLGPDRVIDHFDELWDAVAELREPARA